MIDTEYKICSKCKKLKSEEDFHKKCYKCKECRKSNNVGNYIKRNIEWSNKIDKRHYYRLWKYNITKEEFENLLIKQNKKCKVCNIYLYRPCIDHSHKTGKIRGLLCHKCNSILGFFNDDIGILLKAADYIFRSDE